MEFSGQTALLFGFSSFVLTLILLFLLRPVATSIGLLDLPGGRKQHDNSIPLIGGIGIFFGAYFALWLITDSFYPFTGIFFSCLFIMLLGVIDDLTDLNRYFRLLGQLLAVVTFFFWVYHFLSPEKFQLALGDNFGFILSFLLIAVTFIGYINAFNMIDGVDGLSGGTAFLQIMTLSFLLYDKNDISFFYFSLIFCAALFAFLLLNFFNILKIKIFMGDAGSTLLGFILMALALQVLLDSKSFSGYFAIYWFLFYPLLDFFHVAIYRLTNKKSPMSAGREHFHHLLIDNGLSHKKSVMVIWTLVIFFALIGSLMRSQQVSNVLNFSLMVVVFAFFYTICNKIRSSGRPKRPSEQPKGLVSGLKT